MSKNSTEYLHKHQYQDWKHKNGNTVSLKVIFNLRLIFNTQINTKAARIIFVHDKCVDYFSSNQFDTLVYMSENVGEKGI